MHWSVGSQLKAFDTWPLEPSDPQFDLLSALRTMISSSAFTWTTRHVPGHQDDDDLSEEEGAGNK